MTYRSTKTWPHSAGLTVAFRQWKAEHSHCRFLHGYALEVSLTFEAEELNLLNWVVDFGMFTDFKNYLKDTFDHKTLVAEDDPLIDWFRQGQELGCLELIEVKGTGCEKFAELVYDAADLWLEVNLLTPRVRVVSAEVREHAGNSAIYSS